MLSGTAAFAINGAPGVAVTVSNAQGTAFQGVTDGTGRFVTGPLAPGLYTVELRSLKTAVPARYYLSLSGARPVGQAMGNFLALRMQAEVTSTKPMTGEVRANRVILVPATPAANTKPNQPVNAGAAVRTTLMPNSGRPVVASMNAQPRPGSTPPISHPASPAAQSVSSAAAAWPTSGSSALVHQPVSTAPRTINGQRYVWQPSSPGSSLGRWVPAPIASTPHPAAGPQVVRKTTPTSTSGSASRQ